MYKVSQVYDSIFFTFSFILYPLVVQQWNATSTNIFCGY